MSEFPKVHTVTGKFMFLPRDHVHAYVVELEHSVVIIDTTLALSSAADVRRLADATKLEAQIASLKPHNRPLICTEYMARTRGSRFETHLPVFKFSSQTLRTLPDGTSDCWRRRQRRSRRCDR
jgi:hypothetical protein